MQRVHVTPAKVTKKERKNEGHKSAQNPGQRLRTREDPKTAISTRKEGSKVYVVAFPPDFRKQGGKKTRSDGGKRRKKQGTRRRISTKVSKFYKKKTRQ